MSKRDFRLLLEDIVEAIDKIKAYTENLTFEEFNRDGKTSDAVVRNLEIIGEASSRIPKHIREKYTDIEWHKI